MRNKENKKSKLEKFVAIFIGIIVFGLFTAGYAMEFFKNIIIPIIDDFRANSPSISLDNIVTENGDIINPKDLGIRITEAYYLPKDGDDKIALSIVYPDDEAVNALTSTQEVGRVENISVTTNEETNEITSVIINSPIKTISPLTFIDTKTGNDYIGISNKFVDVKFRDATLKCKIIDGKPYDDSGKILQYIITLGKIAPSGESKTVNSSEHSDFPDSSDPLHTYLHFPARKTENGFMASFPNGYTVEDLAKYGYITWTTIGVRDDYDLKTDGEIVLPEDFLPAIYLKIPNSELEKGTNETQKVEHPNFNDVYKPIEGSTNIPPNGNNIPENVWDKIKDKLKK
ncbi:MAG: hypothetical protein BWY15_00670 [Firmicutes bacterium ADurb.Bin193]|nr:MAG: hypothetical protein BWY15_00670 [Firmicutes bacterium ADurb.Bin193]